MPPLAFSKDLYACRRRKTRVVMVGDVGVGGSHPIRLQSMTTTRTQDTEATVAQAARLAAAGCEIIRITAPSEVDARNLKNIAAALRAKGVKAPLVADIHFRPEAALEAAEHVEKIRINPGNFADAKAFKVRDYSDREYGEELARIEDRFTPLVLKLKRLGRALRVGVNHGSLSDRIMNRFGDTPEGMVESALEFVRICERNDYRAVILSMKASNPKVMIAAYRLLAARMDERGMDYPFHLGVTEAGDGEDGRIKSAVGIGSLLEDGIGDTIRVSLTEEPEAEIPVARRLAAPYNGPAAAAPVAATGPDNMCFVENLFRYARRPAAETPVGPIRLGAAHPPRAVLRLDPERDQPGEILAILEKRLKAGRGLPPEILAWPVRSPGEVDRLERYRAALRFETSRLGFLARVENENLIADALAQADAVSVPPALVGRAAPAARGAGKGLWIAGPDVNALLEAARPVAGQPGLTLALEGTDVSKLLHGIRWIAAQPWVKEARTPLHLSLPALADEEDLRLRGSVLAGSLLADGVGDSLSLSTGKGPERDLELMANILQGAGARITKAEFVSCPSCGRTLFDLQTTTERIKRKTGHLVNVKIAIMGCIVNGPGEMADADFGYVGAGPGKINLYVGKECVEKGVPADKADERLIALIRRHEKWTDPQ